MTRILVVDDEPSIRVTLKVFLEKEGYHVDVAPDAFQAFALLKENTYDIVMTDIVMPGMTGMELLALLRAQETKSQVIVMTGEPTVETAVEAVRGGASDYLTKPIDRGSLVRVIRHAVEIRTLQAEKEALERERLEYQSNLEHLVAARTESLQRTMQGAVELISSAVELRDPYTAGHQHRVGNLSARIAETMGKTQEFVDRIRICGYLHDIGKMVVPAEILTKPGRLNEMEIGIIHLHAQRGFEMISHVDFPGQIAEIVYQHHERPDGSGYPRGLKGAEILEESLILGVADSVEAMMSHRPYRAALGLDHAMAEIEHYSGTYYAPEVVSACTRLLMEEGYLLEDRVHGVVFRVE